MPMEITYRSLKLDECDRISEIDASQYIGRAWRGAEGDRRLIEINYMESGFPNGYENHLSNLKSAVRNGGAAIGAFYKGGLVGFCSVKNEIFGTECRYALLDQLFVSNPMRGRGIGSKLFYMAASEAKRMGADKLYICAGSSEETIAFYFFIGCVEAKEINQKLYQLDIRDYQLEFDII